MNAQDFKAIVDSSINSKGTHASEEPRAMRLLVGHGVLVLAQTLAETGKAIAEAIDRLTKETARSNDLAQTKKEGA